MKQLKKLSACFMAVLVLLTSLSIGIATAESEGYFQYEIIYDFDFETETDIEYAVITKYNGSESVVTIPSAIGGYPVQGIEYAAFMSNASVTSVTVPDTVEYIGDNAFENCVNLTQLNLPDTITSMGYGIVTGTPICENAEYWEDDLLYIGEYLVDYDDSSENKNIEIKEGTKLIASLVFGFSDIESVSFPESLKVIDNMAFSYCENLKSLTLPEGLETLGYWAFEFCNSLTEVTIPASVTNIKGATFAYCENLSKVNLPENMTEIPVSFFEGCKSLKSIEIPDSVTLIDSFAFAESGIETVNISEFIEIIIFDSFFSCKNLTSINVDSLNPWFYSVDGVLYGKDYDESIFICCYPAGKTGESFTLPENVSYVSEYAFCGVKNLKTLVLNDTLSYFYLWNATSLEKAEVPEANQNLRSADGVVYDYMGTLMYYPSGKKDTEYTVPDNIFSIAESAFSDNPYLTELTISDDHATDLNSYSIINCENLKVINLPISINITDVFFIGDCDNLNIINFGGTKSQWDRLNVSLYSNCKDGLYLNTTDGSFELIAPYEEETDFTDNTEPAETTPATSEATEPTETTPVESSSTEPAEDSAPAETTATTPVQTTPSENNTSTVPEVEFAMGDVNMDSKLNIRDATAIQKHLAKIAALSDEALTLADYNEDGKVNVRDATTIQKKIAGLI